MFRFAHDCRTMTCASIRVLWIMVFLLVASFSTPLAAAPDIFVTVHYDRSQYAPGDTAIVGLKIDIPRTWHLYGNPLGMGAGLPLKVTVNPSEGVAWIGLRASHPRKYEPDIGEWVWAYRRNAWLFVVGVIGPDAVHLAKGTVDMHGLMCSTSCVEISSHISIALPVVKGAGEKPFSAEPLLRIRYAATRDMELSRAPGSPAPQTVQTTAGKASPRRTKKAARPAAGSEVPSSDLNDSVWANPVAETSQVAKSEPFSWDYSPQEDRVVFNIWLALFFAFIAGLLLNIMPCVLPVLGIKILSFSEGHAQGGRSAFVRSLVFSAGMLVVFLILASMAAYASFSWGEQFRDRKALVAIVTAIVFFALGMFDFYTILIPGFLGNVSRRMSDSLIGDFVRGVLATILATPCSGPFLGATLAWTLRQSAFDIYLIFTAVGVGMALPYVLFASSRRLMRLIPRPGPWMEDFKHLMGFFLLGVAVYLMIGLPADAVIGTLAFCLSVVVALAIFGRFTRHESGVEHKLLMGIAALAIVVVGGWIAFGLLPGNLSRNRAETVVSKSTWIPFSADALLSSHAEGRSVAVDFTAAWCMNCQYNKLAVLNNPEIDSLIVARNVLALRADLTTPNNEIESLLHHLGSESVPFFALFPGDDPYNPVIMRDVLHKAKVRDALLALPMR